MSKILLLGGTGAMGVYLAPELIKMGYNVFITSRSAMKSDNNKLIYIQGNAHEDTFLKRTLSDNFDVIVDFMTYSTDEFLHRYDLLLKNTKHYVFLSSTRVFANSNQPVTEKSPRILEVSDDSEYLATDDYNLAKARQENILRESQYKNWTIVRPGLIYSKMRLPLGTLEADTIIFRAHCKCPVILPEVMFQKHNSMTWGGDVAKMFGGLVLNPKSFCEDFNVVSHKRSTWEEISQYYKKLIGLTVIPVKIDTYINITGCNYQILKARMNDRVFDNSKILKATGMKEESISSIYSGLEKELQNINDLLKTIRINYVLNAKIDRFTNSRIFFEKASIKEKLIYYCSYTGMYEYLKYIKRFIR